MSKQVVHLVGSIPLENANDVFQAAGPSLGNHLRRIPDGETGIRKNWIRCIHNMLLAHPQMEIDRSVAPVLWRLWNGTVMREIPQLKFVDGVDPLKVEYSTPYLTDAVASFAVFDELQRQGKIAQGVKFQICIPTPLAPGYNYISRHARSGFVQGFGNHLVEVVRGIADQLPAKRIAIQWDACMEILMWEGYYDYRPANYKQEIFEVLARMGNAVPQPIELGYHLCYGSPKDEHLIQPVDTANMVEIATGIVAGVRRPIDFLHLPVPKDRLDETYYLPLSRLALPQETDLYLGLVHFDDDAGNKARLELARQFVHFDGVSTECGWGRADPERVPGYLSALSHSADQL
jgi:hypothetical protein